MGQELAMEVFARYGLLGLVVLTLIVFGPRLLDRLTAWAVTHAENEDRSDDKMQNAVIDQLQRRSDENAALLVTYQSLAGDIIALRGDIHNLTVLIKDFDARLSLYFRSRSQGDPK